MASAIESGEKSASQVVAELLKNWEKTSEGGFTANQVIDAYLIGKEHGKTEEQRILAKTFEKNFKRATTFSEEKFHQLKSIFGFEPTAMRMRILDISSFETLFILAPADYKSDKIEAVYAYLIEEMKTIASEDFTWSFVVMPAASEINDEAISSDGYTLRYSHKAA